MCVSYSLLALLTHTRVSLKHTGARFLHVVNTTLDGTVLTAQRMLMVDENVNLDTMNLTQHASLSNKQVYPCCVCNELSYVGTFSFSTDLR